MKLRLVKLLTQYIAGAVVTVLVMALNLSRGYGILKSLCDGFFVPAVILLGVGGIIFVRNRGSFDLAGYGISSVFFTAFPGLRHREKEEPFEYIERKRSERKPAPEFLITGGTFLLLTVVFLVIYELNK